MNPSPNQNRAGIFDGEQHSENGIPISLIDTKTNIEVEGGEFNFPESVQYDNTIYTFTGKNYDVIQELFKLIGATWDEKVTHVKSGDIIICIRSAFDDVVRTYTGTITQILSAINESCGCKHVESGATMTNHETGEVKQMINGGIANNKDGSSSKKTPNFTINTTKDAIKNVLSGKSHVSNGKSIQTASLYLRRNEGASPTTKDSKLLKKQQELILRNYADIIPLSDFKNYIDEGTEHRVYGYDKSRVIKINSGYFYNSWQDYFNSLLLHNYFFPDTAYEFIGFTEENGKLFSVVKQPFIESSEETDLERVKKFLSDNGFKNTVGDNYINEYLGIVLEDLHDKNIIINNGFLYFIDTIFYIKKDEATNKEYGGKLPELNSKGGYDYKGQDDKVADKVGLITLPKSIHGTNCTNCIFFKNNFCDHEKILLPVNSRMCCALWSDKSLGSIISNLPSAEFFPDKDLKEKKYPLNDNGGFDYLGSAVKKAKAVDLITLPKNISGTSCKIANCKYTDANHFCTHPKVLLPVTDRMSCSLWDNTEAMRSWKGGATEILFKGGGNVLAGEATWNVAEALLEEPELMVFKNGGKIAQGYIIAPYSKLKGIFGEPNVKNSKEKIGWYMAIDKNHIGAIWTEADKSVKTIMKEKFHKWFVWGANEESQRRLYEATRSQVKDIDPVKQKEKDKAISVQRWVKKRDHITEMANNIHKIKTNVGRDLDSNDEKEALTALVVATMLQTSERVGNEESMENGHCGVTGFQKRHVNVIGNKVLLDYVGKSGVEQEKSFTDKKIAKAMKRAIKNSPSKYVFETSDGFKIRCDKVNKYLEKFSVTAKNIRGFNANKFIIKKLEATEIPEDPKQRKKIFNTSVKLASQSVGHGASTLKKHYMIPELMDEYVLHGRIIDMKKLGYYHNGGGVEDEGKEKKYYHLKDTPSRLVPVTRYFMNPDVAPKIVENAGTAIEEGANSVDEIYERWEKLPVKEVPFRLLFPMQDEMDAQKIEELNELIQKGNIPTRKPYVIEYEGNYYLNDGHHRAVALYLNDKPIVAHVYEIKTDTKPTTTMKNAGATTESKADEAFDINDYEPVKQDLKGYSKLGASSHNDMIKYLFAGKEFKVGDILQHREDKSVIRLSKQSMGTWYYNELLKSGEFGKRDIPFEAQTRYQRLKKITKKREGADLASMSKKELLEYWNDKATELDIMKERKEIDNFSYGIESGKIARIINNLQAGGSRETGGGSDNPHIKMPNLEERKRVVHSMTEEQLKNWLARNWGFRGVDGKGITRETKNRTVENMRMEVLSQMKYNDEHGTFGNGGGTGQDISCVCFSEYLEKQHPELHERVMNGNMDTDSELRTEFDKAQEMYNGGKPSSYKGGGKATGGEWMANFSNNNKSATIYFEPKATAQILNLEGYEGHDFQANVNRIVKAVNILSILERESEEHPNSIIVNKLKLLLKQVEGK